MSKGSRARPLSVPQETFAERWERAFGDEDWRRKEAEAARHIHGCRHRADDLATMTNEPKKLCPVCGLWLRAKPRVSRFRTTMNRVVDIHGPADPETKEEA